MKQIADKIVWALFCALLAGATGARAMDSATFAADFGQPSLAAFTLDSDVTLADALSPRAADLALGGGGYALTIGGHTLVFQPAWNSPLTASLSNLTLRNATAGAVVFGFDGAAGRSYTVSDSTFSGNANAGGNGGAISASGQIQGTEAASVQIFNTGFSGNSAANGGAVYFASNNSQNTGANNPMFKLYTGSGLSVTGNSATSSGGALYLLANGGNNAQNYFEIDNYLFSGNTAAQYGGAIYNGVLNQNKADASQPATSKFSITGNSFTGNSALYGGAIATTVNGGNGDSEFDIGAAGDMFSGNTATGGKGGVIYNAVGDQYSPYGGSVAFNTNGTYSGNSAAYGGAIYNYLARGGANVQFNVYGTYQGNSAAADGGAIYNYANNYSGAAENSAQMNIHAGARFEGNKAAQRGGAIFNNNVGILNIDTTASAPVIFDGNRASVGANNSGTPSTLGDDIYQASATATTNLTGSGLVAMTGGFGGVGTINVLSTGGLYLSGVSDPFGVAASLGLTGGASDNSGFTGTFNLKGGTAYIDGIMFGGTNNVFGNTDLLTLLAVSSPRESIYFNVNLWDNGALQFMSSNPGAVEIRASSGGTGAGMAFLGTDGQAVFAGLPTDPSSTSYNAASYYLPKDIYNGQANTIAFFNSKVSLGDKWYDHSTAYQLLQGSVIDLASSSGAYQNYAFSSILTTDSLISFKVAGDAAGAIGQADTLTVGAGYGTLGIGRVYVNDSLAAIASGATARILFGASPLTLADTGVAQYVVSSGNVYAVSVRPDSLGIVFGNVGTGSPPSIGDAVGGNVEIDDGSGGTTTIDAGSSVGVQIGGDTANTAGGASVAQDSDVAVYGDTPGGRTGTIDGGGDAVFVVDNPNSSLNVSDVNINDAHNAGGGAVIDISDGSSSVTVSNVGADGNTTDGNGGVINITDGNVSVGGSDFSNNTAAGSGGAINADGGSLVVSGGSFSDNHAADGGAISVGSGSADLSISSGTSFTENTATGNGGAIYNDGALNLITTGGQDIVFSGNSAGGSGDDIYNGSDTSVINISGDGGKVSIGDGIGGTGQINKSGDSTLELGASSDSSDFTGSFAQSGGTTDVAGDFFGGTSVIGGGVLIWDGPSADKEASATLIITDDGSLMVVGGATLDLDNAGDTVSGGASVYVDGSSTLELSNSGATATINGNDVISGHLDMTDGNIIFDGPPGLLANYDQTGGTVSITNGADLTLSPSVVISGGNIVVDGGTLNSGGQAINLAAGGNGDGSLTLANGGRLNLADGVVNDNSFAGSLNVSGNAYIGIDLSVITGDSDRLIFADQAGGSPTGSLILDNINFVGGAPTQDRIDFSVVTAGSYDSSLTFGAAQNDIASPIFNYGLDSEGNGDYSLTKKGYNPTVFRGQAAALSSFQNQLLTLDEVWDHLYLDSPEAGSGGFKDWQFREKRGGAWAKAYGAKNKADAGRGVDMDGHAYGLIAGVDFAPARAEGAGLSFMPSAYLSASASSGKWSGAKLSQDAAQLGVIGTLAGKGWMASALAYASRLRSKMDVAGARDKSDGWGYGAAAKAAYFADLGGGLALAPNIRAMYGEVGSQNWHSAYGDIDLSAGRLKGLAVAPGVDLAYETEGWRAYASASYVKNIGVSVAGTAAAVSLPSIELGDFAEAVLGGNLMVSKDFSLDAKIAARKGGDVSGLGGQLGATWRF
ncbi:hypothetical protein FACS1894186_1370 [Alphaproteobacteria bacterium]|nr:hypothetical protein FACS1894186_1370 [Alphaproteobacteria bacterium]